MSEKESEMIRTKTKRILWTIAVMLSLVGVMLLHKPYQPKIMGNISKEDASKISKSVRAMERSGFESEVDYELMHGEIRQLLRSTSDYLHFEISSLAALPNGHVLVNVAIGKNEFVWPLDFIKEDDIWVLAPRPRPQIVSITNFLSTNTPVPRGAIVPIQNLEKRK